MIAVVDYGMGNIGSILNMLKKAGADTVIDATKPEILYRADKILLPGVGAFDMAVQQLKEKGFWNILKQLGQENKKVLFGICLGMQLLGKESEEGKEYGLDLIPFRSKRFQNRSPLFRVPHMGWDYISVEQNQCLLAEGISKKPRYYFVHSYYVVCEEPKDILMKCDYGTEFAAAVHKGNIYGTQFHPEKSHRFGMELLRNFVRKC